MNEKAIAMIDSAIEALEANSTSAPVVEILKAAKAALPPLRAREEIAPDYEIYLNNYRRAVAQARDILTRAEAAETVTADALSSTAGEEWRDRIGEALLPFALLARRYDHHKAPDDEIVRSHGTLGKPGDRGYTHITVSDLRRAATLLDELAAAGPIVAEKSHP